MISALTAFVREPLTSPDQLPARRTGSTLASRSSVLTPSHLFWTSRLHWSPAFDRRQWELCAICDALRQRGSLREGSRGLGILAHHSFIAALLAAMGCELLIADASTSPRAFAREADAVGVRRAVLDYLGACGREAMASRVSIVPHDTRALSRHRGRFDFVWSSQVVPFLGSLSAAIGLIRATCAALRPGGVAVHALDLNLSSASSTPRFGGHVLFRHRDLTTLGRRLEPLGCRVLPIESVPENSSRDGNVATPPWASATLTSQVGPYVATSLCLVIEREPAQER